MLNPIFDFFVKNAGSLIVFPIAVSIRNICEWAEAWYLPVCDWSQSKSSAGPWQTIRFPPALTQQPVPHTRSCISPETLQHCRFHSAARCHFQQRAPGHEEKSSNCHRETWPSCDLACRCLIFSRFPCLWGSWAARKEWLLLNDKIMNVILKQEREGGRERVGHEGRKVGEAEEESILQSWQMCPHARESI